MNKTKVSLIAVCTLLLMLIGCSYSATDLYPPRDSTRYYDTIEEAVSSNSFEGEFHVAYIGEIIKLVQNDKFATLFFKPEKRAYEVIYVYNFYTKTDSGKIMYSRPLSSLCIDWEMQHKYVVNICNMNEIGEVRHCIHMYSNDAFQYLFIDDTKRFVWGLSQSENIRSLKIEGQPVTEVIEIELGTDKVYFWYFDDLKTDKMPKYRVSADFDDWENYDYNSGEMEITFD